MLNAIGGVELSSVAKGMEAADAMLKTSNIKLILSRSICPGKYIALVAGDVGDVNAAVVAKKGLLVEKVVIPQPRQELLREII